jgi:hypothetical protein
VKRRRLADQARLVARKGLDDPDVDALCEMILQARAEATAYVRSWRKLHGRSDKYRTGRNRDRYNAYIREYMREYKRRQRRRMQEQVRAESLQTSRRRPFTKEDARDYEESWYAKARLDFWTFRRMVRPSLIDAWWQEDVANELTRFWRQLKAGKRPKLVLGAPPQHGKSDLMKDFCAWSAGKDPDSKIIFGSYADELGISTNLHLQCIMTGPAYRAIFPKTKLAEAGELDRGRSRRTTTFLEFVGRGGSFRNTTVNGVINGFGLDLGVIDDPIKGRAEAQSKPIRDKTWAWLTDDFFNRFPTTRAWSSS